MDLEKALNWIKDQPNVPDSEPKIEVPEGELISFEDEELVTENPESLRDPFSDIAALSTPTPFVQAFNLQSNPAESLFYFILF